MADMMGRSHLAHGVTMASWASLACPVDNSTRLLLAVVIAAGSLAPDLDHINGRAVVGRHAAHDAWALSTLVRSFGGHRTWTHDPVIGPPVFGVVAAVLVLVLAQGGPLRSMWWLYGLAFMLGCLTHLYGDARTPSGIPFGQQRIRLGRPIETGSPREDRRYVVIYRPASIASAVVAAYLAFT